MISGFNGRWWLVWQVALVTGMLMMSGCRKDLCYDHYRAMTFDVEWEQAWERDHGREWSACWDATALGCAYEEFLPGVPEGITLLIYNGEKEPAKTFLRPDGGELVLGEGVRSMLFYNNDTRYIVFDDMASAPLARASTSTRSRASFQVMHAGERTINPPDVLYGAFVPEVPEVELHENYRQHVVMRPLVHTYLVRFKIESGAEYVSLARGALAGMAESVMLRNGSTSEQTATILFDCEVKTWGAEAQVCSFGVPGFPDKYYAQKAQRAARNGERYSLNLELMLRNGRMKTFFFDVTDQLADQPRGGVIEVGGITIGNEDISTDSGFDVNVSDWGEYEDIDLPIGH